MFRRRIWRGPRKPTAEDGTVVFTGLDLGLFLVVQNENATGFYPIDPFVVTVPILDEMNGEWVFEVDACPKSDVIPNSAKSMDTDGEYFYENGGAVMIEDTLECMIDYYNEYRSEAAVVITDVLDNGLTYVSSDPQAEVSINDEGNFVLNWILGDASAYTAGFVTFTAVENENALTTGRVQNTADVLVGDHEISTNTVGNSL